MTTKQMTDVMGIQKSFLEAYSAPLVFEIEIDAEGVLCQSGIIDDDKDNEGYGGENDFEW